MMLRCLSVSSFVAARDSRLVTRDSVPERSST